MVKTEIDKTFIVCWETILFCHSMDGWGKGGSGTCDVQPCWPSFDAFDF